LASQCAGLLRSFRVKRCVESTEALALISGGVPRFIALFHHFKKTIMPVTNSLEARFVDAATAASRKPQIEALVRQGQQAHAFWQAHRQLEGQGRRAGFWSQFRAQFPDVHTCLHLLAGGNRDQALLGFLEFGAADTNELYVEGEYLFLKAPGLWCGAEWDLLAAFLKSLFGAEAVAWIGDDPGIDFFDLLQP
jgi:hypothetical protein